jgi:hypothetical protein
MPSEELIPKLSNNSSQNSISLLCKSLPPRQTIRIQIRLLANSHSAAASSDTKSRIIEYGGVVDGTIVPYGYQKEHSISFERSRSGGKVSHTNIILPLPPMPELRIVLLNDHLQEPVL